MFARDWRVVINRAFYTGGPRADVINETLPPERESGGYRSWVIMPRGPGRALVRPRSRGRFSVSFTGEVAARELFGAWRVGICCEYRECGSKEE